MKIAIGNDHRGFKLKNEVVQFLKEKGFEIQDFGCFSDESADYPEYGFKVASAVSSGDFDRGLLVCGSGIGMSIVANKVKGIRAALCHTVNDCTLSRSHNNANVLVLSEEIEKKVLYEMLNVWLKTEFQFGGRHERRVNKIHELTGV